MMKFRLNALKLMTVSALTVAIITVITTTACSTIKSSLEYTRGTECMERGDYEGAIVHLENAVKLDPDMSRNYNNLAVAYIGTNNFGKAWYYSRQAMLTEPVEPCAYVTFKQLSQALFAQYEIKPGKSIVEIISHLGEPDMTFVGNKQGHYFYGTIILHTDNGKLERIENM